MNRNRRILSLITLVLLVGIMSSAMGAPVAGHQPERVKVLIGFRGAPGPAEQALVRRAGGSVRYSYRLVPAIAATVPETALAGLRANPNVVRVEPDLRGRAVEIELDNAWGVKHIGAGTVHNGANKGESVSIAIIDSGVNYEHPDLDDNYAGGYDFIEDESDTEGDGPMDVYGHGTHVAGTACAEDNDNGVSVPKLGVVGVAPACSLYALRVLDDDGYGYASQTIAAMQWAVEHGMQVTNLSLGWDRDPGTIFKAAFDSAWNAGLVTVAAAGNSGNPPGRGNSVIYPAKYDSVIAVAATDAGDNRASFSSTGEEVELAAPGVSVYSTWNDATSYYDPQPVCGADASNETGCYKYGSGTSMASPHVAGVAALVIASGITDGNEDGHVNDEVRQRLQSTADDLGAAGLDPRFGYGLVDADEAATTSAGSAPIVSWVNPQDGSTVSGTVTIQISASDADDNLGTLTVEWRVESGEWQTAAYNSNSGHYEGVWDSTAVIDGEYTLTARATDSDENVATGSILVTADNVNDPPTASFSVNCSGLTCEFDASTSSDPDGTIISYDWDFGDGNTGAGVTVSHTYTVAGTYAVALTVTDDGDATDTQTQSVSVSDALITIHVGDLDGVADMKGKSGRWEAFVTVLIHDADGYRVSGATVTGEWSGVASGIVSGITGNEGTVTFSTGNMTGGEVTWMVLDVTHEAFTYDADDNHDPDGDSDGTTITISPP